MNITYEWLMAQSLEIVGNGREFRLNCPNCDDTTKHMYINITRTLWYCFKCGKGGKVQYQNQEPNLEAFDNELRTKFDATIKPNVIKSLPINDMARNHGYAHEYLIKRGVTDGEMIKYSIRASLEKTGPYKNSIIFPMFGEKDWLDYFVCRKYDNSKPKYVNAPWSKDDTLFEAHAINTDDRVKNPWVICEGIFDALAIRRVGYNAVALLGKTATSQQLKTLIMFKQFLIYLDEDAFSQAINLKLQLNAVGTRAKLIVHDVDAAQLYLDDTPLLRTLLDGATKQLNEYKK
jgi:DNA primase (bacterial type)